MAQLQSTVVTGSLYISGSDPKVGIGTTNPGFKLQVATPTESTDPISFAFDITRENSTSRGMTFGMATDDSYGAIGTHNANLQLGHTFNLEANGQPAFYPTLTIKHTDQDVGSVGIGATDPSDKLEIAGLSNYTGLTLKATGASRPALTFRNVTQSYLGAIYGTENRSLIFESGGDGSTGVVAMTIDSSGRVGIGSTPKTQHSNVTDSFNVGSHLTFQRTKDTYIASNFYYNSSDAGKSIASGWTPLYLQDVNNGVHAWYNSTAAASAADETVSIQERMRIDSSGNVGIGTATPENKLHIIDTSNPGNTSGSVIIEGRRDGTANLLTLRAKDASAPTLALPNGQGSVLRWQGFDGTDFENMGYILVNADGQAVANGDAPSYMAFGTSADGSSTPAERMRIDSSGRLFLGTATVAAANAAADDFVIKGEGAAVGLTISNSNDAGTGTIFFGDSTSSTAAGFRYNHNTGDMAISAEDNITITADAVGIGTTSPSANLHVVREITTTGIEYPFIVSGQDVGNNIDQGTDSGIGIKFEIAGNDTAGDSLVGASIVAMRESGTDANSSTGLAFLISQNDTTLDEAVRIDHDGNVGIGTTSPLATLHLSTTTGGQIYIEDSNSGDATNITEFSNNGGNFSLQTRSNTGTLVSTDYQAVKNSNGTDYHRWFTNGSNERMRIDSSGQVYFKSSTDYKIGLNDSSNVNQWWLKSYTNGDFAIHENGVGDKFTIQAGGNVGIGTTTPNNKLEVEGSSLLKGLVTVTDDIFPEQNYVSNIGSIEKKFLTLHVAELVAETLVASERRATVGGRFNVGIATQLSASLNNSATTIYVKHNNLNNGDIIHLEGDDTGTPKVEFMSVDSGDTPVGDGFRYTVTRNLDGSGANEWDAGSGVFNTGTIGNGFIDQYAINSLRSGSGLGFSTAGPTIAFMERTGSAYPDIDIRTGVGNLKGWYGYNTDKFGFAAGDYKNQNITVDESNGLRIRSGSDIQLHASSSRLSIGDSFLYDSLNGILYVSGSNIQLVTPSFFLGGENQYISGSGGSIEISGSNFHLLNGNITASNVDLSGKITATSGKIGGWEITSTAITSSNISFDSDNESIALGSPTPDSLTSDGIFLSGSGEFNFQVVDDETGKEYIRQSGGVLDVRASKFFIGDESAQFISGANSNIEISSSLFHLDPQSSTLIIGADAVINADVTANSIRTPATIDGAPSTVANASSSIDSNGFAKFVSASIGGWNVDEDSIFSGTRDISGYSPSGITLYSGGSIHTPNFYVDTGGNAFFKGTLSAPAGNIGGFTLSADAISGDNFYLSGSATGNEFFISSSNFQVTADGAITADSATLTGPASADAFLFSLLKISSTNQSDFLKPTGGGYYALDLSGGTPGSAQFVRFESSINLADPLIITHIIAPKNNTSEGFRVVLEGTADDKIKLRHTNSTTTLSSGTINFDGTTSVSANFDIGNDGNEFFKFNNNEFSIKSGERVDLIKSAFDYKLQSTTRSKGIVVQGDITGSRLQLTSLVQPSDQTEKTALFLDGNNVTANELGDNAYTSAITVGTGLDITNATTAPTISLDLTEITLSSGLDSTATGLTLDLTEVGFTGGADRLITNDNDGTVTAQANLTFDGTDLYVNGNVGIGTSTPTAKLQVSGDVHIGSASSINSFGALQLNQTSNVDEEGIAVLSAAGGRSIRIWVDETQSYINSGNGGGGNIILNEGAGKVGIGNTNPPEALTVEGDISASGDLHIQGNINGTLSQTGDLSISSGNVVLASGQGIDFSATANATGTSGYTPDNISEVLDDYEEGFWKPIFTSTGIASIGNQDIVTGTYVKIGRAVHINAYLRSDSIVKSSSTSAAVYISNLPFSPDDGEYFSVEVGFVGAWGGDHPDGGYIDGSNSRIILVHRGASDGASSTINAADLSTADDANKIMFSATYFTD